MLPKIQFYLYIFLMQLLVKKKEPKHTHTKITKQEKPTKPSHPQVPTNPEICIKQKRARNSYGPAPAYEA